MNDNNNTKCLKEFADFAVKNHFEIFVNIANKLQKKY